MVKMYKKGLNILVTGANGYIGMRLIPKLVENGHKVYCAVRNPERLSLNPELLKKVKVITIDFLDSPKKIIFQRNRCGLLFNTFYVIKNRQFL